MIKSKILEYIIITMALSLSIYGLVAAIRNSWIIAATLSGAALTIWMINFTEDLIEDKMPDVNKEEK